MSSALAQWVARFTGLHIFVVGDLILDEYLTGRATRLSREAPIPVLEYESRQYILGGAGNPAANIAALGGYVTALGVVGADSEGETLRRLLAERGINAEWILTDPARATTLKTRIMAHMGLRFPQQVARIDRIPREAPSGEPLARLIAHIVDHGIEADAILFSDYHNGLITPEVIGKALASRPQPANRPLLTADAQGDLARYRGFDLVKCNLDEARAYWNDALDTDEAIGRAADSMRTSMNIGCMVITRGADGVTVADTHGARHIPAPAVTDVYDTVGAGDTAIAVITLALAAGAPLDDAVRLANYASGLVVRRVGNYAPTANELLDALRTT